MIFASFLTVVFIFMAFYSAIFIQRIVVRYCLFFSYTFAIFFIWAPNVTTTIANFFGIGRGLDFILILFSVAIVNGMLFIVKHLRGQHQNIMKLTRYIAIRDAFNPQHVNKASTEDS
jgi:hypothetical protein